MRDQQNRRRSGAAARGVVALAALLGGSAVGAQDFTPDPLVGSDLPAAGHPHWVWVNDFVFHHMADGKTFLIDGDAGRMLGMLSTGFGYGGLVVPSDRSALLSPETYFSRGTRGTRTDVVTFYDPRSLKPTAEVEIPPKRVSAMPMKASATLTDDDRFLLIYNFTPAQSVTVVDAKARTFVGEIDGGGCALIYPTGPRSFFSLCGDGGGLAVKLDDSGKEVSRERTPQLFDAVKDPVTEKGVRLGNRWLFATFSGDIVEVESDANGTRAGKRWSLTDEAERAGEWRPGGFQHLAVHAATKRLYSLMHVGGKDTHKDPGTEIWVYDLDSRKRVQKFKLEEPATSIAISQDAQPLLFAIFIAAPKLDVYDPGTGRRLRSVGEIGFTPTNLTTY